MQHIRHTLSHTHTSQTVALGPSISRALPMLAAKRNIRISQEQNGPKGVATYDQNSARVL